jgi:hypothetical protein
MPDFLTLSQSRGYATTSSIYTHFSRFLDFFNMRQFNEIVNSIGRLLDLVMCNKSCRVAKADDVLVPEDNYHPALEITTSWTEDTHSVQSYVRSYVQVQVPDRLYKRGLLSPTLR